MGNRKQTCIRCLQFKWSKGRGLCETCWKEARANGFIHYPRKADVDQRLVCHCKAPIPEAIGWGDARQCKKCGKKVLT